MARKRLKPHIGKKLALFIKRVEKQSNEKIKFKDREKCKDAELMANTFVEVDKSEICFDPSRDYSDDIGQCILAEEVAHIHFHKNLKFQKVKIISKSDGARKRLVDRIGSLVEDLLAREFLEKRGFGSHRKRYKKEFLPKLDLYKTGRFTLKRVESQHQEIMKQAAVIYGLLFARSRKDRRKVLKAFSKTFSKENLSKLNKICNDCENILRSKETKANRYQQIYKLLLKRLGLESLAKL